MRIYRAMCAIGAIAVATVPQMINAQIMPLEEAAHAFGARERVLDVSLSPDGTKIAMIVPGPQQATVLQVLDLATGEAKPINFADGNPMTLRSCGWASNDRLICYLYGVAMRDGNPLRGFWRMIALNADGSKPLALLNADRDQWYAQGADGWIIDWRDGTDAKVLMVRNYAAEKAQVNAVSRTNYGLGVDLMDAASGKVQHVESADTNTYGYIADGQGHVRIKEVDESLRLNYRSQGKSTFYYRPSGTNDWRPFSTYDSVDKTGMYPLAVDGTNNSAYVVKDLNGRSAIYRVALDGTMSTELIASDPIYDIDNTIHVGRRGRVVGTYRDGEKTEQNFFDPQYAKLRTSLGKALPSFPQITIVDSSADEKKHLIFASSDRNAGRYYYFDSEKRSLSEVANRRPAIDGLSLGEVTPIRYKAADGKDIPAYLTLPPGGAGKNLPAIVMPHGGPWSRDSWGFDWLAQFFVARGFAVIQPNFRGSTGFGEDWELENGFKSWRTAIGDVNDAGKWLVSQGIADPQKLAIVGWSYGGYAALQSNVLDPTLFKAVIAIAPVTDFGELKNEWLRWSSSRIRADMLGNGPYIQEGSPARNVYGFKAPVLMFHGENDINVDVDESRLMDRALKKAGKKSSLVIYPKIDHQLRDSTVLIDMLTKSDTFLRSEMGM